VTAAQVTDDELFDVVRTAILRAKAEVLELSADQVGRDSVLAEPPIVLDSLEFVGMVTQLEEMLGLAANDDHIAYRALRTVRDVTTAARKWIEQEPDFA
jgi:acyl carrier protein